MNWLRDNILKILIILGALIVVVVIVALVTKPKTDVVVSGTKYGELENKLQSAAIKYIKNHKKLLPTDTDKVTKIKLKTLQSNNYIGKLVSLEDASVKCDGYVEISKLSEDKNDYRYTPYISCGNYYVTKTIGEHVIDVETQDGTFTRTSDAGLYKSGEEYIFKGEKVNNYLSLDSHLYRIVKVDSDKYIELISTNRTGSRYVWDNRYNIDKDREYGVNDFIKSRLYDSLEFIYNNTNEKEGEIFFSSKEKDYIVDHDYCIGKRALNDANMYSGVECNETISLKVGLITVNEYARASIDPNCKSIYDKSCANYNYFNSLGTRSSYTYATLTAVANDSFEYYRVNGKELVVERTSRSNHLYPVVYLNNKAIYSSGSGTLEDPYIVR